MSDEIKQITLEDLQKFVESNEDAKKWVQSIKDSAVTKGISTYKQNFMEKEFPALLNNEIKKLYPEETQEQKRLKELEVKFSQVEQEKKRAILQSQLLKKATEKQLPDFLVDYAIDEDEEKSYTKLDNLGAKYLEHVNKTVEERLTGSGRKAPVNSDNKVNGIDLNNLPTDPQWYKDNAEALEKLMK